MAQSLQATSFNTIITLVAPPIIATPIILSGLGMDRAISFDADDNVEFRKTVDGRTVVWVRPGFVNGTITIQPLSTALQGIRKLIQAQNTTGLVLQPTLTISNPVGLWTMTYQNFTIKTPFKGFELSDHVDDYEFNFSAELPDATILGDIVNAGIDVINLIP